MNSSIRVPRALQGGVMLAALVAFAAGWSGCQLALHDDEGQNPCVEGICQQGPSSSSEGGWELHAPSNSAANTTHTSANGWEQHATTAPHNVVVESVDETGVWKLTTGRNIWR